MGTCMSLFTYSLERLQLSVYWKGAVHRLTAEPAASFQKEEVIG